MIIALVLGCVGSPALESGDWSVLTYNVHGLPSVVTEDDTLGRLEQIAPQLDAYDLAGLQEDFVEEGSVILDEGVSLPYRERFDERVEPGRVYGSGLTSYSRTPILSAAGQHFRDCHGTIDGASDCFASKGFQVLEVALSEEATIQVVNTHIEAGGGEEDEAARAGNVEDLILAMSELSFDVPLLFMGDTNLHPNDPVDGELSRRFEEELGLQDLCTVMNCSEPNRIDRIYFRSGTQLDLEATGWAVADEFVDSQGVDLSDHNAISGTFRWAQRQQTE